MRLIGINCLTALISIYAGVLFGCFYSLSGPNNSVQTLKEIMFKKKSSKINDNKIDLFYPQTLKLAP